MFNLFAGPFLKESEEKWAQKPIKFWIKSELIRTQQIRADQVGSDENQLEQIPTNRSVEAKDQRPFRQNPGLKREIQLKIKPERETGEPHQ